MLRMVQQNWKGKIQTLSQEHLPPLQMLNPKRNIILHKSHPRPVLSGQFTVITVGSSGFSAWLMRTKSSCKMPISFSFSLLTYSIATLTLFLSVLFILVPQKPSGSDYKGPDGYSPTHSFCSLLSFMDWRFRQNTDWNHVKKSEENQEVSLLLSLFLQSFSISRHFQIYGTVTASDF